MWDNFSAYVLYVLQVHLGEGIAVCEEQLRAVKWSDYRKLTRGLAAILFSPTELATCSVTGQRWSRAGTATERPVKPALDKSKVQAIICKHTIKRSAHFEGHTKRLFLGVSRMIIFPNSFLCVKAKLVYISLLQLT